MTPIEILLQIAVVALMALALGEAAPGRSGRRAERLVRLLLAVSMTLILLKLWIHVQEERPFLLLLAFLAPILRLFAPRFGRFRLPLAIFSGVLFVPAALIALSWVFLSDSQVLATAVSPNGKWEARLIDNDWMHEQFVLDVAPRGLVSPNPFIYPSRRVQTISAGADQHRIYWRPDGSIAAE